MKRRMLFISGVDLGSPFAGEEEFLIHEWLKKITERFEVTVLATAFAGCKNAEVVDGITYLRIGSKRVTRGEFDWRGIWEVFKYYRKQIRGKQKYDLVIERWDRGPFLFGLYGKGELVLLINRLWRDRCKVFPQYVMWAVGLFERIMLWFLRGKKVLTTERSLKSKLVEVGFEEDLVGLVRKGVVFQPVIGLDKVRKYKTFTIVSAGVIEPEKMIEKQFRIFQMVKENIPEARWVILGSRRRDYWEKVSVLINQGRRDDSISYLGSLDRWRMMRVVRRSQVMLSVVSSLESASASGQGTVVVCEEDEEIAVKEIVKLYRDKVRYKNCQEKQYLKVNKMLVEKSVEGFQMLVEKYCRSIGKQSLRVGVLGFAN